MTPCKRTYPRAARICLRAIHRLPSANSIVRRAVFFSSPPVAHLGIAKLLLDHPKRVFDLGPDAGLEPLSFLQELMQFTLRVIRAAPSRSTKRRYRGRSCNSSSMAGSLRFHHSCRQWMRSMVSMGNGGCPPNAWWAPRVKRAIRATSAAHGTESHRVWWRLVC